MYEPGPGLLGRGAEEVEGSLSCFTGACSICGLTHLSGCSPHAAAMGCMPRASCERASHALTQHVACRKCCARPCCAEIECCPASSRSCVWGAGDAGLEASHWDALLNMAWCPVLMACPEEGEPHSPMLASRYSHPAHAVSSLASGTMLWNNQGRTQCAACRLTLHVHSGCD